MDLKVNDQAPNFKLPDQNGKIHSLADYKGKWVLIYFYPKDDTPGCTKEACGFRDKLPKFQDLKVTILGISVQDSVSHAKFAQKYQLPFTLLADQDKEIVNKYGVWGLKKFIGKIYYGTLRTSFLINPEGKIAKIYEKVKPEKHIDEVLADLNSLNNL